MAPFEAEGAFDRLWHLFHTLRGDAFCLSSSRFQVETVITEGQPLLALGYGEVKEFSPEQVLQWTAASLREGGEGDNMIQKAVAWLSVFGLAKMTSRATRLNYC